MTKPRLLFLFAGMFSVAFAFGFMIGTSFLTYIPLLKDLLLLSTPNMEIQYGLNFFKYLLHNITSLLLFGSVRAIVPGIIIVLTALFSVAILVASFFKKRNEMMFHVPFIFLMGFGIAALTAFFFGIVLYDGTTPYNYFQVIILNELAPPLIRVFFIVIFITYLILIVFDLLLIVFIFVAPAKTEKYLAKQYEKEFATIKEVRNVSSEEFGKYIREHVDEIRDTLGLNNQPVQRPVAAQPVQQPQPAPQPKPAVQQPKATAKPQPKPAPVIVQPTHDTSVASVKGEAALEGYSNEAIAEPAKEDETPAPKKEDAIAEPVKEESKPLNNEQIALEIAKAVAANASNTEPGTKTTVYVESNGTKQQVTTTKEKLEEPAKAEAVAEPVEEAQAEPVVEETPKKKAPPFKKKAPANEEKKQ